MNNLEQILLSLTACISLLAIGAERSPQLPKVMGNSSEVQELRQRISNLPSELRQELLNTYFYVTYPNSTEMANCIRALQDKVTPAGIVNLLQSMPKAAIAVDVVEQLSALHVMQSKQVQDWRKSILLVGGEQLYQAIDSPRANAQALKTVTDLLTNPNIDLNWKNSKGAGITNTPLIIAAFRKYTDLAKLLLDAGANPNIKNGIGKTALMAAAYNGNGTLTNLLIKKGAHLNIQDENGETALMEAVYLGGGNIIKQLLDAGADPDIENKDGKTARMIATQEYLTYIAQMLNNASAARKANKESSHE